MKVGETNALAPALTQMIVDMVYNDLFEFAGEGIPVLIVPGNHER